MVNYNWKTTNLALFGSDEHKKVNKEAAAKEEEWKSVRSIKTNTLLVWRIKNFKLELVKPEDLGKFFSGDSYVILRVEKLGHELVYDVHFWIGKDSTQDEYGTAAYKCVELDTLLDDQAIQHREVDGFESELFKSYFETFELLEGGYCSGFNSVKPEEFKPRLLLFHGTSIEHIELSEVPFSRRSLDSSDVFILDLGTEAYQWNGSGSSKDEKYRAAQYLQLLEAERNGRCKTEVIDEIDKEANKRFLALLPDVEIPPKTEQPVGKKSIHRLSDESGKMQISLVCEEALPRGALTPDDVFLIDTGSSLFVYIGEKCSRQEKMDALSHAHDYLNKTNHPLAPITVVSNNRNSKELNKVLE